MTTMLDQVPRPTRPTRRTDEERTSTGAAAPETEAPTFEETERYRRAKARMEAVRGFFIHLTIYLTINAFLLVLNLITTPDHLWFYWPLLGWGAGVAINGLVVFGISSRWGANWEERKIRQYMNQDR